MDINCAGGEVELIQSSQQLHKVITVIICVFHVVKLKVRGVKESPQSYLTPRSGAETLTQVSEPVFMSVRYTH